MTQHRLQLAPTIICLCLLGCARVNSSDEPDDGVVKSIAGEGSVFSYHREWRSDQGVRRDTVSIRLTSKAAAIGGRTGLLAFEGEGGTVVMWDVMKNGDLWRYAQEAIAPDPSDPMRSDGAWICYPTSGYGSFAATTLDTTIHAGDSDLRTRVMYFITTAGSDSITIGGRTWAVQKVNYRYYYDRWLNGEPRSDSYSTSGVRSYIKDLGVLAEQHDNGTSSGYNYELSFKLFESVIK